MIYLDQCKSGFGKESNDSNQLHNIYNKQFIIVFPYYSIYLVTVIDYQYYYYH